MCTVPKPYPKEFREDVVRVARNREPGVTIEQIAADFGITRVVPDELDARRRRRGRRSTPGDDRRRVGRAA